MNDEDLTGYNLFGLDSFYSAFTNAFMKKSETLSIDDLNGLLLH